MNPRHSQPFTNAPNHQHSQNQNTPSFHALAAQHQAPRLSDPLQQKNQPFLVYTISKSELNSSFYELRSDMLLGTTIKELIRAKVRFWLHQECSRLKLSKKLCCLTNTLIDLFFSKGGIVTIQEFHSMALACLLLANKLIDNVVIPISNEVFPRKQLNDWEQKVCLRLAFKLNPICYVDVLHGYLGAWSSFSKMHHLWSYDGFGFASNNFKNLGAHHLYELMDFAHLFLKSYQFPKGLLEWQGMKLLLQADHQIIEPLSMPIQDEVLISFWINPEQCSFKYEPFQKIIFEFQMFLQKIYPWLADFTENEKRQSSQWLRTLLLQGVEFSQEHDVQIWRQTKCESWLSTAKTIMHPPQSKNQRKCSSDTTF